MARIRFSGTTYHAKPLRELPNGDWIMEMLEHGPRFSIGTQVRVTQAEVIDIAAPEPAALKSLNDLIAAMAEERKTLPTVQELIDKHRADEARRKTGGQDGPQEA